jgi:2',3'-cyclic-nucleotide 2'-phosphodiesterase (5'-nucleotidase family)
MAKEEEEDLTPSPSRSAAALRLINVTDTYKFDNFASLKTLIEEKSGEGIPTKSIMSGDFLAPYLLSSYDDGEGMMRMLNALPIDFLTWGNHDINDLSDAAVMKREREYTAGVLINSNMTEHPTFAESTCQVKYHVEEVSSPDGTNVRRIGFLGLITDDPKLFKNCNPGMKKWGVQNPWDVIRELTPVLAGAPHHCDLVVPICHLYEKEDAITCKEFDFPVILSGHDHHVVDEVIHGTRLLKAGSDCDKAILLDISWSDSTTKDAEITAQHVTVADWSPNPEISLLTDQIQSVLKPLMHTKLAEVPAKFSPLSTSNERGFFGGLEEAMKRGTQCTMGQFILSLMRDALNTNDNRLNDVDACVMKGGNIKCSQDWPPNTPFTLAMLFALWSPEKECHIFTIPGSVLQGAFVNSYDRPHNGWIHYDDSIVMNNTNNNNHGWVTHVNGQPLDPNKLYQRQRFATGQ